MRSLAKRKILFTLAAGISLGLHRSPQQYFKIIGNIPKEWNKMKKRYLRDCIHEFYNDKVIDFKEFPDGTCRVVLTEKGRKKVIEMDEENMTIKKPISWDKKWRLIIFDIPEGEKYARNALRQKLKNLGFYQIQKSVLAYPYHCLEEIEFLVELFQIRPYVKYVEALNITNDSELKLHFSDIL